MPFPNYTSLPQYANILHLWKLDEESGTRLDFIGSCDLADNNTVLYGTGRIYNAADFESDSSEYLSATSDSSSDMDFTNSNFSISFWVKPESLGGTAKHDALLCRGAPVNDGWFIYRTKEDDMLRLGLYQAAAAQYVVSTVTPFSAGTLCHITVVRDGTTGYIYKDGSDITSASDTLVNPVSSGRSLYIGKYETAAHYLDGLLDELIVWNVALSSAEVSTLYNWYSKVGLSGAMTFSGDLGKKPKKTLIGAISFTGILSKKAKKLLTGDISFIGVLSSKAVMHKLLEGAITFVGTLQRLPKKVLTGSISFEGTLIKKVKKTLTGAITFVGKIFSPYWDGIWSLFTKITTSWTGQDKKTTTWAAQDKEDTTWTEQD